MNTVSTVTVQPDSFLTLHYRLAGADGDLINTFADAPATLQMGSGMLAEALEARLLGLAEGAHTTYDLPAGSVFGEVDPARRQWIDAAELDQAHIAKKDAEKDERQVGEVLQFTTPEGEARMAATVASIDGQRVLLDFNHPLAGQPLNFEVQIIGIL